MNKRNRKTGSLNRVGAAAFLLLLSAGTALAISADGRPGPAQRQQAMRRSQIAIMDIFARDYGGADFSPVTNELEAHPEDPGNAAFMSVPLSLANVYLNRYEVGWQKANLERSVQIFEWVVSGRQLWGGRDGTGSVVSYLDISLERLRAECDVGGFESRIENLWQAAMEITAEEADAALAGPPCGPTLLLAACVDSILPFPADGETRASRAALFSAASSFLPTDPRATAWAESARSLTALFPASECQPAEVRVFLAQGRLSQRLAGGDSTIDLDALVRGVQFRPSGCSASPASYETSGPVDVVSPGDSLAAAIHDGRVVASMLTERYLWQFSPGSQCEEVEN